MTRTQIYREVLRLDEELRAARQAMKQAQVRARVTGTKLPGHEYAAMWERIHRLERTIETTRLQLSTAEETAAERFVVLVKLEYPAVFAQVAGRTGVEH
jgi:hypothetical protein